MVCFLLRTSLIPITQIISGCIILDKNVSFLNMNDLFKMTFYFLQVIPKGGGLTSLQGMDVIFLVLYAPISNG
jgi:hypothetical protein